MPLNQYYPSLNGITPSWADFSFKFSATGGNLIETIDIKSINTSVTLEIGEQRGASGGRVMSRTTGSSKFEASAELYYSGYQAFLRGLKEVAPLRGAERVLGVVHFDGVLQWQPPGTTQIFERRIYGCRFLGSDINGAEGNDPQIVPIKLNPIKIVDVIDGEECVIL